MFGYSDEIVVIFFVLLILAILVVQQWIVDVENFMSIRSVAPIPQQPQVAILRKQEVNDVAKTDFKSIRDINKNISKNIEQSKKSNNRSEEPKVLRNCVVKVEDDRVIKTVKKSIEQSIVNEGITIYLFEQKRKLEEALSKLYKQLKYHQDRSNLYSSQYLDLKNKRDNFDNNVSKGIKWKIFDSYDFNIFKFSDKDVTPVTVLNEGLISNSFHDLGKDYNENKTYELSGYFKPSKNGTYYFKVKNTKGTYLWIAKKDNYNKSNAIIWSNNHHKAESHSGNVQMNNHTYDHMRFVLYNKIDNIDNLISNKYMPKFSDGLIWRKLWNKNKKNFPNGQRIYHYYGNENRPQHWNAGKDNIMINYLLNAKDSDWYNTGSLTQFSYQKFGGGHYFLVDIIGYFKPSYDGVWLFELKSDDFSYLWIQSDTSTFTLNNVNKDNSLTSKGGIHHAVNSTPKGVELKANKYYPIRIHFGENKGGEELTIYFEGPNVSKTTNGKGYFFNTGDDTWKEYESEENLKLFNSVIGSIETNRISVVRDPYDLDQQKIIKGLYLNLTGYTEGTSVTLKATKKIHDSPLLLKQYLVENGKEYNISEDSNGIGDGDKVFEIKSTELTKYFSLKGGKYYQFRSEDSVNGYSSIYKGGEPLKSASFNTSALSPGNQFEINVIDNYEHGKDQSDFVVQYEFVTVNEFPRIYYRYETDDWTETLINNFYHVDINKVNTLNTNVNKKFDQIEIEKSSINSVEKLIRNENTKLDRVIKDMEANKINPDNISEYRDANINKAKYENSLKTFDNSRLVMLNDNVELQYDPAYNSTVPLNIVSNDSDKRGWHFCYSKLREEEIANYNQNEIISINGDSYKRLLNTNYSI